MYSVTVITVCVLFKNNNNNRTYSVLYKKNLQQSWEICLDGV